MYSEFEPREQSGEYRSYREVLASVVRDFARELRFDVTEAEAAGLADSIRDWEPFADTVPALQRLHSRYKLAILSNIDDDLFAYSARKLQVRSIASSPRSRRAATNLRSGISRCCWSGLQYPRDRLLHVGESLYHDVGPAHSLGIATVWVNRRQGKASAASKLTDARPDMEVLER